MNLLISVLIASVLVIAVAFISKYLANKLTQPKIDAIEAIGEMDIPIGEKIRLMNKIKP